MLKYFPRQFFLSCLFSLSLFVSVPAQAQDWGEWAQSFKDWWSNQQEQVEEDDEYGGVYVLMALFIASGLVVDGGCE